MFLDCAPYISHKIVARKAIFSYKRHKNESVIETSQKTVLTGANCIKSESYICNFCMFTGQMRSLRLFYSNDDCTSGQMVIASRESQYKILYFHHGGMEKLAECLADWNFLAQARQRVWNFH